MGKRILAYDFSVLENPLFTGVERYAASLLENLPQELPDWQLVGLWRQEPDHRFASMASSWDNRVAESTWPRSIWRRLHLRKMAQACQADLLVSPVAHVPTRRNLVSCRTVHDLPNDQVGSLEPRTWKQKVGDRSWGRLDVPTIFPSEGTKNEFSNLLPHLTAATVVIPHGVDLDLLTRPFLEPDPSNRNVVVIGTIRPRRRPDIVEAALKILQQTDPTVKIRWIGALPNGHLLDSQIDYLGTLDDLEKQREIALASCVLCPSLVEGFGIPLLEGLAMGKAVIAADRNVGAEVGGDHVAIYDGNSAEELSQALRGTWALEPTLALAQKRRDYAKRF